ncbi:hypothetical protein [Hymenobacter norwichensis]|uniref:hypothetical protein n=1 Tax=Hymenobacter norwichensis TaxID=223903 RepID=UPI0003B768B3|nr:hypothetical protein [Hymenobacter norwichensis]
MHTESQGLETVYTITDWYDGARIGVADFRGQPHYYECIWDEAAYNWSDTYLLSLIDTETLQFALEDWSMWLRWKAAFDKGETTQETHPVLPEDRLRHAEIEQALAEKLVIDPVKSLKAVAEFHYGENSLVRWSLLT